MVAGTLTVRIADGQETKVVEWVTSSVDSLRRSKLVGEGDGLDSLPRWSKLREGIGWDLRVGCDDVDHNISPLILKCQS